MHSMTSALLSMTMTAAVPSPLCTSTRASKSIRTSSQMDLGRRGTEAPPGMMAWRFSQPPSGGEFGGRSKMVGTPGGAGHNILWSPCWRPCLGPHHFLMVSGTGCILTLKGSTSPPPQLFNSPLVCTCTCCMTACVEQWPVHVMACESNGLGQRGKRPRTHNAMLAHTHTHTHTYHDMYLADKETYYRMRECSNWLVSEVVISKNIEQASSEPTILPSSPPRPWDHSYMHAAGKFAM